MTPIPDSVLPRGDRDDDTRPILKKPRKGFGVPTSGTSIELAVRSALTAAGYSFRTNVGGLPGRPDIVIDSIRAVVFVHGCFWHGCPIHFRPTSVRSLRLQRRIESTRHRDARVAKELMRLGWRVATVWEHEPAVLAVEYVRRFEQDRRDHFGLDEQGVQR